MCSTYTNRPMKLAMEAAVIPLSARACGGRGYDFLFLLIKAFSFFKTSFLGRNDLIHGSLTLPRA
jgi:hypothetical protein